MSRTKSLLSILFIAVLGTLVTSCGSDTPRPTGVTLSGNWITKDVNTLPTNQFEYNGLPAQIMADKKCVSFTPINKFATAGTGKLLVQYPYGPLDKEYWTFKWSLNKEDMDNIKATITFDEDYDGKKTIILYRVRIGQDQFSYSLKDDLTQLIGYDNESSISWDSFTETHDKIFREDWTEAYKSWLESNKDEANKQQ